MKLGWEEKSARRLAYTVAVIMILIVPIHYFVSCRLSGLTFEVAFGLLVLNGVFCYVDHSGKGIRPFVVGAVTLLVHMFSTH